MLIGHVGQILDETEAAAASQDGGGERGQELLERLNTQRELLLMNYRNLTKEEPHSVSTYYASQLMVHECWHLDEYVEVLKRPVDLGSLARIVRECLGRTQVEVLVHGNATVEEAREAAGILEASLRALGAQALPEVSHRHVVRLPAGPATIFEYDLASDNPSQENCCTQNVYQVGTIEEDRQRAACCAVACHLAGTSCYDRLRTQEQLGYTVQAWALTEHHVMALSVLVQGNRLSPSEVDARIEAWLESFGEELRAMSEEEFANNVAAVINERTHRDLCLAQETTRHWAEIQHRRYRFDRAARSVEALEALTKSDLLRFFDEYLAPGAPQRRKLSVRVVGTSAQGAVSRSEEGAGEVLRSLAALRGFKAAQPVFAAPEPATIPESAASQSL